MLGCFEMLKFNFRTAVYYSSYDGFESHLDR